MENRIEETVVGRLPRRKLNPLQDSCPTHMNTWLGLHFKERPGQQPMQPTKSMDARVLVRGGGGRLLGRLGLTLTAHHTKPFPCLSFMLPIHLLH
jgi:hypothetical protein